MNVDDDNDLEQELKGYFSDLNQIRAEWKASPSSRINPQFRESATKFKKDYPDPAKTGFVMMRFLETKSHNEIVRTIKDTMNTNGLIGFRADDKDYTGEVFSNVQTYMHECGFGIAVFERIVEDEFNPNIALDVGYMLALGKPVCLFHLYSKNG
jgi:nucleoside 2-deoxyribosyltransferase